MPGNFVFVAVNQYCRKKPRCIITMHLGFFFCVKPDMLHL